MSPPDMTSSNYYTKLRKDAESIQIDLGPEEFYDFWHTHVDWDGVGNQGDNERRKHLEALFIVFNRVQSQAQQLKKPFQSWINIDPSDSAQDAVYLHTQNPNGTSFPYDFEGVSWGIESPKLLKDFVTPSLEIGRSNHEGIELYWIRLKEAT